LSARRRFEEDRPFLDVEGEDGSFTLPKLKWRELLFVGALVPEGELYRRNPARPLPLFRDPHLFPEGVRFRVIDEGPRVRFERVPD